MFISICIFFIFCFIVKRFYNNVQILTIPGPFGLPLMGNLLQFDKFPHLTYRKWAKEFGSIFQVKLLSTTMVVISDHKMVKEAFSQTAFSGRMDFSTFDIIHDGEAHGVVHTEGSHWEELHQFTMRQLRDFGFGKKTMEDSIMVEVNELIEGLGNERNKSVTNINHRLLLAVVNSLWFIATGTRYKQDDSKLIARTTMAVAASNEVLEKGGFLLFAPWLATWFPKLSGFEKIKSNFLNFGAMFQSQIDEHVRTYSPEHQRDFLDKFLKEIYATTDEKSPFYGTPGMKNLRATLADLYFAGTETTALTISWMLLYLTNHPEVQENIQKEIESVTGNSRRVSLVDKPRMPYMEAVIAETLRFSSIGAIGIPHKTVKDVHLGGHYIPKDMVVVANFHFIHSDPKIWGDPHIFRPSRFLDENQKVVINNDALMAFSTGRRRCIGETLARDSVFLFATNILQEFTVSLDNNGPEYTTEPNLGFLLTPKVMHLVFKNRAAS